METRYQVQQKAASASRAGGGSGNEETTGPYGVATGPRPARERPGELEVRKPKEDHFGVEGGGGDYGRERDERRGGKGKGKGPLGREESRSTPTPTPSPAPRPAPRNNKDGPSGDAWEVLSEEECQSAKDSAAGQNINVGVVREEGLRTPSSSQAVYPSDGTSSTDGGASRVQSQDALHPMRAGMKGAAPQASTRENDELREENWQLKEKVSELGQKLKESEKNVRKMVCKCERLQREASGDKVPQDNLDGGESLMDQVDELRTEVWERDDKIKELEKELAYNVERSRTLTIVRDHSTNQSRIVMTLKDRIKALEEHLRQRGEMDALSSDSDQESLTALVTTLETANDDMGRKLKEVENKLKQELKDKNKRISDMRHEIFGHSSDKGKLEEQNTALNEYLEKAHRQLEQCKQEKEEGKKYLEELQTQLAVKTTQVTLFEEDFQAERNSRAEAVGKMDDVRKEYETKIEEMRKEYTGIKDKFENIEELLLLKQQQFHEHLETIDQQHKDYQEKMESDLAAKAAQVKQYYKQTMAFKEQVENLAKEREEALKHKELTKRVLKDLRKKCEADSQSAAPESRSTGLFAKQKKPKKSKTMEMTSPVDTTVLQEELLRLKDKVEVLSQEKAPVQHVDAEESTTAGMSQQQLMNAQQRRQKKQELGPWPQLIEVDTGTGPEQKQHHHQRGRQNEHERPGSAEWDDSFQQDESNLDFWQPTSLPQAYSEQQQKQSQRGYGGNMGQPHPNTDPCLLDTGGDDFSAYDRRNADAHGSGSALPIEHPPGRPPRPPGGAAARDKGSGVAVSRAEVSHAQSPKRKAGAGSIPRPQKSMEEQLPAPIYPPAAVEYDRDHDRQREYYDQEGDNLMLDLGSDIQDNAEMIRGEVGPYKGRDRQMTLEHVPFDPNLTCPYCQKVFRKGEIQKFKRHVATCKGSADGGTVV